MFYFSCVNAFLEMDFIYTAKFVARVVHNITLSFLNFCWICSAILPFTPHIDNLFFFFNLDNCS